eukprot:COSAG05_NODE_2759_length_2673_cov_2.130925_2_plen_104_part_00
MSSDISMFESDRVKLSKDCSSSPWRHVLQYMQPGPDGDAPLLLSEVIETRTEDPSKISRDYRVSLERDDSGLLLLRVVVQEIMNDGHHYPNWVVSNETHDATM